jgi:uncharacterized membrane protein YhhN
VTAAALATAVALGVLLLAEWRGWRAGVWVAKPLASTGFLVLALAAGATGSAWGRAVLVALGLSWLGDVLLIPKGARAAFLAGLASFLLAHLAYAVAFALRGVEPAACAVAALGLAGPLWVAARWLWPHVPARMRPPVVAYGAAITGMLVMALGSRGFPGQVVIALGASAFFVSDLAVARERFVAPGLGNKLWGLPLYYGGQLALAVSVAY